MENVVLKVEELYKQYRLGVVGTGTLKDDIQRFWARLRGVEDPLSKIGEDNALEKSVGDYVWALRGIDFSVKEGEVLGIIGKNGAGKSTLLKILSKVTSPTKGNILVNGRIASLLEVGTGFHPELTGRENIFLNGAILGMKRHEIRRNLDEIVDFSGVEKYIDTPVKRYSSGMYVRLAFAVAAHLEPEILIVDEVLAVGDVEFQRKAIGKMQDVSKGQGRTVLFVSHNMGAVQRLCDRAVLLANGQLEKDGETQEVINLYLKGGSINDIKLIDNDRYEDAFINDLQILNTSNEIENTFSYDESWYVKLDVELKRDVDHFVAAIGLSHGEIGINTSWSQPLNLTRGKHSIMFSIEEIQFKPGDYSLSIGLSSYERAIYFQENVATVTITDTLKEMGTKNTVISANGGLILNQFQSEYL